MSVSRIEQATQIQMIIAYIYKSIIQFFYKFRSSKLSLAHYYFMRSRILLSLHLQAKLEHAWSTSRAEQYCEARNDFSAWKTSSAKTCS